MSQEVLIYQEKKKKKKCKKNDKNKIAQKTKTKEEKIIFEKSNIES